MEQEFGEIDAKFWSKIAAAKGPPRNVPGGGRSTPLLPLLVNFGRGVGSAWRIQGKEVAVFRAPAPAGESCKLQGGGGCGCGESLWLDGFVCCTACEGVFVKQEEIHGGCRHDVYAVIAYRVCVFEFGEETQQ